MDLRLPACSSSVVSKGNFLLLASTERKLGKKTSSRSSVKMDLLHSQSCSGAARLLTRVVCIFYELFLIAAARVQTHNRTQAD